MYYVGSDGLLPLVDENDDELVAIGGFLSNKTLLDAYSKGLFPWFNSDEQPICWYSLNPRLILEPSSLYISSSMKKMLRQNRYKVLLDNDFEAIINLCSKQKRRDQDGTWITKSMINAYMSLHKAGFAHSIEVYNTENRLVGGFYGLSLGSMFCGESMVSLENNVSKYALIHFVNYFKKKGLDFIDCQQATTHMISMGGTAIPRTSYLGKLKLALQNATWRGDWAIMFADF